MDVPITRPAGKARSKGRLRESIAKPIAVDAEPGVNGSNKDIGGDLTWSDWVSEEVRKKVEDLFPRPENTYSLTSFTGARASFTGARVKNTEDNTIGWICLASLLLVESDPFRKWKPGGLKHVSGLPKWR